MANQTIILKRGTQKAIENYKGIQGELVVDIDNQELRLMNGNDLGGKRLRYVVKSYQDSNNFYRVYSDGWIEQGGSHNANSIISFPIAFTNTKYNILSTISFDFDNATGIPQVLKIDNVSFKLRVATADNIFNWIDMCYWYACGY